MRISGLLFLIFGLTGCYTATLDKPKIYDIYLADVSEARVFDYAKYMAKQSYYKAHKVLVISNDGAEISYTSKLAPEMIFQKTQDFFGENYRVKLHSNVVKVEALNK